MVVSGLTYGLYFFFQININVFCFLDEFLYELLSIDIDRKAGFTFVHINIVIKRN